MNNSTEKPIIALKARKHHFTLTYYHKLPSLRALESSLTKILTNLSILLVNKRSVTVASEQCLCTGAPGANTSQRVGGAYAPPSPAPWTTISPDSRQHPFDSQQSSYSLGCRSNNRLITLFGTLWVCYGSFSLRMNQASLVGQSCALSTTLKGHQAVGEACSCPHGRMDMRSSETKRACICYLLFQFVVSKI